VYDITVPDGSRFVAEGVVVHNCEDFIYTGEWALTQWGAAKIKRSNGEPAVVKNPQAYPYYCLAGNMMIETANGQVPFKDIKVGDMVVTRLGLRKVLKHESMGIKQTISLSSLQSKFQRNPLVSTRDHKILSTFNGTEEWIEASTTLNKSVISYSNGSFGTTTITAQADTGMQEVFDMSVEEAEHFIANGIVVHNCKHIAKVLLTIKQQKM